MGEAGIDLFRALVRDVRLCRKAGDELMSGAENSLGQKLSTFKCCEMKCVMVGIFEKSSDTILILEVLDITLT